jgi:hypothetical protein
MENFHPAHPCIPTVIRSLTKTFTEQCIYLHTGTIKEIPRKNSDKQPSYINEYLPFYNHHESYEDRKLDKALFSFGRFLKIPQTSFEGTGRADQGKDYKNIQRAKEAQR